MPEEPQLKTKEITGPEDYGIELPEWLKACINKIPPGKGEACPTDSESLLANAFDLAFRLHTGQFRASGDPYIIHPIAVANILTELKLDSATIATGLLHDTIEDTHATYDNI